MKLITVTVKIRYEDDKGRQKTRNERYLVECRDFSHAIEIVTEEFEGAGESWEISRITPAHITSILNYGSTRNVKSVSKNTVEEQVLT